MILLRDLLAPWFHYAGGEAINDMTLDSRTAKSGCLFVAVPGYAVDGRKFVSNALALGATAVLVHTDEPDMHGQVDHQQGLIIYFFQLNRQLSALAAQCYPLDRQSMGIVGVTGTNGKTSVSQLIAQITTLMQRRAAVMGTLGNGVWGHHLVDTGNTTADAITTMKQLNEFQSNKVDVCAIEVSSHGLIQGRAEAVPFDVGVFTNLSRDHLDYHGDMNAYAAAKKRLFTLSCLESGLLNLDDPIGVEWFESLSKNESQTKISGFSVAGNAQASFFTCNAKYHGQGVNAEVHWPAGQGLLQSPLLGEFNLSNLLAALASLSLLGMDMSAMLAVVPQLQAVPGRMEKFIANETIDNQTKRDICLVVDYAHTPDALAQALKALRGHCHGQLWCVFGCGGDRDKGKRPLMAQAAELLADKVVITSDNPRTEVPELIIQDIIQGIKDRNKVTVEINRITAIKQTLANAQAGDIVLLAGKGHETYQEIDGQRFEYDERALAAKLMGVSYD